MTRARISIALLALPALAHAGPEDDVAALVQTTIDHLGGGPTTFAKGATVIGIRANVFDYDTDRNDDRRPSKRNSRGRLRVSCEG
jgi:hypothetical protein